LFSLPSSPSSLSSTLVFPAFVVAIDVIVAGFLTSSSSSLSLSPPLSSSA
jgi:hypothetical protein